MTDAPILGEKLVNLCPHGVSILRQNGEEIFLPRPKRPARISTRSAPTQGSIDGVEILGPATYEQISDLPEPIEGTIYIVSQITALAVRSLTDRKDVVYPGSAPGDRPVRSNDGKLVSVRCLIQA